MKWILLIAVLIAAVGTKNVNGQFLKDLKNRTVERSKDVVLGKTVEKAADKTGR